jgi:polysaccharide biosynthesis/export protein
VSANHQVSGRLGYAAALVCCAAVTVAGQSAQPTNGSTVSPRAVPVPTPATEAVSPPDYLIGADDVLTVVFWREKDLSGDVAVRPDGRITLPLVNEIQAAGLTPEQLRVSITEAANKYLEAPTVSVIVKQINSRKVFITGQVAKQGVFPLTSPTTVVQLITMAGGLLEYADDENITIVRTENGRAVSFRFNYDEVKRRKNLKQNIELKPGDQIIVP